MTNYLVALEEAKRAMGGKLREEGARSLKLLMEAKPFVYETIRIASLAPYAKTKTTVSLSKLPSPGLLTAPFPLMFIEHIADKGVLLEVSKDCEKEGLLVAFVFGLLANEIGPGQFEFHVLTTTQRSDNVKVFCPVIPDSGHQKV